MRQSSQKYTNTIILLLGFFFVLFIIWQNDAQFIIDLAKENLALLTDKSHSITPKFFLVAILYIIFRAISFLFIDIFMRKLHKMYKSEFDFDIVNRMTKLVLWIVYIVMVLFLLFEDAAGTILTSLGLIGFGVTFALQKPILNFVGWLTINFKSIYKIGDRVKIGNVRGDVCEINMMNTEIQGLLEHFDVQSNKIITVPNEVVLTGEVENYTKDSNYLREDLSITVTYESDFKRAQKILHDIAVKVTRENRKNLRKELMQERKSIEETLLQLGRSLVKSTRKEKRKIKEEMEKLKQEEQEIESREQELEEEYQPKIRIALQDSAVELICQFITPYDSINATKTRINELFLIAAKKERNVEIAYPHTELVFNKTAKKFLKK